MTLGKTYMTEEWQPSIAAQDFAKSKNVDWRTVRDEFVDYWLGCGKPMANWDAVFRNRVRAMLADGRAPMLPPPPFPPPKPVEIDPDALTGEAATAKAMELQAKLFNMGKR